MTKPDYQYDDLPIMTWADIQNSDNTFYTFREALVNHPMIEQMGFAETNANFECFIDEQDKEIAEIVLSNNKKKKQLPLQFALNKVKNKKEFANNDYSGRFDLDLYNHDLSIAFRISIGVGHPETPKVYGRDCLISTEFVHLEDDQRKVIFIGEDIVEFPQSNKHDMLQPVLMSFAEKLPAMFNNMKNQVQTCKKLNERFNYDQKALRKIQKWANTIAERVHSQCNEYIKKPHTPTLEQQQLQAQTKLAYSINEMGESLSHLVNMGYGRQTMSERNLNAFKLVADGDNSVNNTLLERSVNNLNFLLEAHLIKCKQEAQEQGLHTFDVQPVQVSVTYPDNYTPNGVSTPIFGIKITSPHHFNRDGESIIQTDYFFPNTDVNNFKFSVMEKIAHEQCYTIARMTNQTPTLANNYSTVYLPEETEQLQSNIYLPSMIEQAMYFEALHHVREKMADTVLRHEEWKKLYLQAYDVYTGENHNHDDTDYDQGKIIFLIQHHLMNNDDKPVIWDLTTQTLSFGEHTYDFKNNSLNNDNMIKELALVEIPVAIETQLEHVAQLKQTNKLS